MEKRETIERLLQRKEDEVAIARGGMGPDGMSGICGVLLQKERERARQEGPSLATSGKEERRPDEEGQLVPRLVWHSSLT